MSKLYNYWLLGVAFRHFVPSLFVFLCVCRGPESPNGAASRPALPSAARRSTNFRELFSFYSSFLTIYASRYEKVCAGKYVDTVTSVSVTVTSVSVTVTSVSVNRGVLITVACW